MTPFAKNLKPVFLKAVISVTVLSLVFYFVPLTEVFNVILLVDPFWIVVGVFLLILLRILTALRMQIIASAQGLDTSTLTMMQIVFTSTFYNLLAPGALAGGAVTYLKYRQQGIRPIAAVTNIFANKFIQMLVVLLSAPLFWLVDKAHSPAIIVSYGLFMIAALGLVLALLFGRFGNLGWLESKINRQGRSFIHRSLAALCRQVDKIGAISHRSIITLVIFSVMHSLFAAMAIVCFGYSLNIEIGLVSILWIYSVIYLLSLLPISISNIGLREAGMVMLLMPYGVSMAQATAWSVLMYAGPLSCALIGLILEAEYLWLGKKSGSVIASTDSVSVNHDEMKQQGVSDEHSSG